MQHIVGKSEENLSAALDRFLIKGDLRRLIYAAGD